jgi:hypothetical protein
MVVFHALLAYNLNKRQRCCFHKANKVYEGEKWLINLWVWSPNRVKNGDEEEEED